MIGQIFNKFNSQYNYTITSYYLFEELSGIDINDVLNNTSLIDGSNLLYFLLSGLILEGIGKEVIDEPMNERYYNKTGVMILEVLRSGKSLNTFNFLGVNEALSQFNKSLCGNSNNKEISDNKNKNIGGKIYCKEVDYRALYVAWCSKLQLPEELYWKQSLSSLFDYIGIYSEIETGKIDFIKNYVLEEEVQQASVGPKIIRG